MSDDLPPLGPGKGAQRLRGRRRRNLILKVAADLFASNGYDRVSINDIGFAANVSGSAVYRYFPSKEALLVSIFEDVYQRMRSTINELAVDVISPEVTLEGLIDVHLDLAVNEPAKIRIYDSEQRHLPRRQAETLHDERRIYLKTWIECLRQIRPDLASDEVDLTVHATLALISSISLRRTDERPPPRLHAQLRDLAFKVLHG